MKRSVFFVLGLFSLTMVYVSCKHEKSAEIEDSKPVTVFSKEDTTSVMSLVNTFVEKLQAKQFKEATSMIYFLEGDSICELNEQQFNTQISSFARIRGIRYELEYIKLETEKFNDAKINIVLFDKKDDDPRPNGVGLHLNPVRRDGKWYLTTPNTLTDTNANERPEDLEF